MRKLFLISIGLLIVSTSTFAGGLLTNTNQHVLFLRMLARDASTQIDAVYSNPAGVAFMEDGFHLSLNGQSAFQTRTITSTFAPFAGFGGNATKVYKGEASAPFIPSVFAVYKKDKWAFSGNFAVTGGGGKATFNEGLGSFESLVSVVPGMMVAAGKEMVDGGILPINIFEGTNKYSVDSYMRGKQMIFGLQLGASYKITDYLSAFAGVRMNYVSNGYEGHIRNIEANIGGGEMVNVNKYFSDYAKQARTAADAYLAANDMVNYAKYDAIAKKATGVAELTADKELDCDQTGWGLTPIIGADVKFGKWNFAAKYEFKTNMNIENKTHKIDVNPVEAEPLLAPYKDGVNTPSDIPSLLTIAAGYEILPTLRASVEYHFYDDKSAGMAEGRQKYLTKGANEYLAGIEWDATKQLTISGGYQNTDYGLSNNFQTDTSFYCDSYSLGFGAKIKMNSHLNLNIAYFWTTYDDYTKTSENYNNTTIKGTDVYARTNKVFGLSVDYHF